MGAVIDLQAERSKDVHATAREAQLRWAAEPIARRLRIVRELRHLLAENTELLAIAAAARNDRPTEEKLVSEVLPLADACRWLEKKRRPGARAPSFWKPGSSVLVARFLL
jgi:acyl-CoA reductase-like NAD-dependent aldehyde dehydrogenase